mmetsp:Transcript_162182/g.520120  ORF Transcript_162182/g.520120 Transcript_162182/m.520120 type:complete len:299 (-) Transcript_162182:732-1628(-)
MSSNANKLMAIQVAVTTHVNAAEHLHDLVELVSLQRLGHQFAHGLHHQGKVGELLQAVHNVLQIHIVVVDDICNDPRVRQDILEGRALPGLGAEAALDEGDAVAGHVDHGVADVQIPGYDPPPNRHIVRPHRGRQSCQTGHSEGHGTPNVHEHLVLDLDFRVGVLCDRVPLRELWGPEAEGAALGGLERHPIGQVPLVQRSSEAQAKNLRRSEILERPAHDVPHTPVHVVQALALPRGQARRELLQEFQALGHAADPALRQAHGIEPHSSKLLVDHIHVRLVLAHIQQLDDVAVVYLP